MIEIRLPVTSELAGELEAHFCEEYQQNWMIHENWKTKEQELRGFFNSEAESQAAFDKLRSEIPGLAGDPRVLELEDRDWKEAYKLHFKPWSERGLHWVPRWEKDNYTVPQGDEIVYLDPGMAFGTGNHETTRLCVIRLLDARDDWESSVPAKRVVDGGCGSGILAISARKLGFMDVYGFDVDPDSVRISIDNARLCDVDGTIEFRWADLKEGLDGESGDLLLVNILANILCEHVELLCGAVRDGGRLVLSGILAAEAGDVHAVFAPVVAARTGTLPDMDSRTEGDWADLQYQF